MLNRLAPALLSFGAICQTAPQTPTFEVAVIKPAAPINPADVAAAHVGMSVLPGRVEIGFASLEGLIAMAYNVEPSQVTGAALGGQRFDVLAKLPQGAARNQIPAMLQALLAGRFKLAVHREQKERAVLALTVARDGSRLVEAAPPAAPAPPRPGDKVISYLGADVTIGSVGSPKSPVMTVSGESVGAMTMRREPGGIMHVEASSITMPMFAKLLTSSLGRQVADMTNLKGHYRISIDVPAPGSQSPAVSLQKLGLELESRRTPVEFIVVDHAQQTPTDN
jgi:uncharacterized protein (TIGR03435 family)